MTKMDLIILQNMRETPDSVMAVEQTKSGVVL